MPLAYLLAGAEEFDETVTDRGVAGCRLAIVQTEILGPVRRGD